MTGVLAAHRVGEGAAVGLCLDESGHMFLGINSNQVRGSASGYPMTKASPVKTMNVRYGRRYGKFGTRRHCRCSHRLLPPQLTYGSLLLLKLSVCRDLPTTLTLGCGTARSPAH